MGRQLLEIWENETGKVDRGITLVIYNHEKYRIFQPYEVVGSYNGIIGYHMGCLHLFIG